MQGVAVIAVRRRGAPEPAGSLNIGRCLFNGHPAFLQPVYAQRGLRFTVRFDDEELPPRPHEERLILTDRERTLLRLRAHFNGALAGGNWDLEEIIILEAIEGERALAALAAWPEIVPAPDAAPKAGPTPDDELNDTERMH